MNRRAYLRTVLGTLGAAACGRDVGAEPDAALDAAPARSVLAAGPAAADGELGVKVVTDYAAAVRGRGTEREDWAPAFEAAWNEAAAEGTDVFVPAGRYRVRYRQGPDGPGPALDLAQTEKYRPVRMLGPARGAELLVEGWPDGAPAGLPAVRVRTGVANSRGGPDVANGAEISGITLTREVEGRLGAWNAPHDYRGIGIQLAGLYGAAVTSCMVRGFQCALVTGDESRGDGASYLTSVTRNRFQYCNQAVRIPPKSNGTILRENLALWMHTPTAGVTSVFQTGHSTTSVFFSENSVEQCAAWAYGIGATTNARISGGRIERVFGAVRVQGAGRYAARGTQVQGLSVDCDSLRFPAVWVERSVGALVSGITFYQTETEHPHLLLGEGAEDTTVLAVTSAADAPLRTVDRSRRLTWIGPRA